MTNNATVYIRMPNWIGDVCMSLPALQLLLDTKLKVVVCAKPWAKDLLSAYPIHDFISIDGSWQKDRRTVINHIKQYNSSNYFGLLLPDSLSSALAFSFTGIKSVGYIDDGRRFLLKWSIKKPNIKMHAVESWFNLGYQALKKWQIPNDINKPSPNLNLKITDKNMQLAKLAIDNAGLKPDNYILIAPTATGIHKGKNKVWPYFDEFTNNAISKGYQVVMCPPPAEANQAKANAPHAQILSPLGLGAFAALAQQARLVLCNDSGVSHIAAAARANQITLFGVTDIERTGPWSDKAICLGSSNQWPSLKDVSKVVYSNI